MLMSEKASSHKTILSIIAPYLLLLCSFVTILLCCIFLLPSQYEDSFLGELKYKLQRLEETEGKRIIFLGGSSIPFSLKSDLVQTYFPDYEIVDFGMYADLGTVAMLDLASGQIHEGDILIISPEQNPQTLSCYFSGEAFWQAADGSYSMLTQLAPVRLEQLAAAFPVFAGKKLAFFWQGAPTPEGIYARSSFNEYGDIAYEDRAYNIMSQSYNPNDLISFSPEVLSEDFVQEMNAFAQKAEELHAHVYYRFPPMNELALTPGTTSALIDSYYTYLQEQLQFPIMGNPHSSIMDAGWFYDTNFHLNDSGAIVFTKGIIEDLKLLQKDTSPTALALPAIPQVPVSYTEGDSSQQDYFTYQETPKGWIAEGLTEEGALATTLIIPSSYQGEPVVGISDTLFAQNTHLEELTIQENIGTLYDNMFQGCLSLKKLILTGKPTAYTVGEHLLDGVDCLIYVPEDSFNAYERHYSWQRYRGYLSVLQ